MNSNTQFLPLPDPAPQALNQPQPPDRPDPAAPKRGRSKIDRLPRHLRNASTSSWMMASLTPVFPNNSGPKPPGITVSNLSDWFSTGHQLWLKNQAWRDELHARMDAFQGLAATTNPTLLSRSGLLVSMLQICEQLRDLGPQPHQQQLQTDFTLGTLFDRCQFCHTANPILPGHERAAAQCRRCGVKLPPPGQRYVMRCPQCGVKVINVSFLGHQLASKCRACSAKLPFLESADPPTADPSPSSSSQSQSQSHS